MTEQLPRSRRVGTIEVSVTKEGTTVTITMAQQWRARRLAEVLMDRAGQGIDPVTEVHMWRSWGKEILGALENRRGKPSRYRRPPRPPFDTACPEDVAWVVKGIPPYPVLSGSDMRRAYAQLETAREQGKPLKAEYIAERLHVSPETVWRWRRETRRNEPKDA